VLQTLLPALWSADAPSEVLVSGGTHNPMAPPFDFLQRAWLPLLARMGIRVSIELLRHGFHPAGGGEVRAIVRPSAPAPIDLESPGEAVDAKATAIVAAVPRSVAERELAAVQKAYEYAQTEIRQLPDREGPGNALNLQLQYSELSEVFCSFGERRKSAEAVAQDVVRAARAWERSRAAVGEHLADQLVLPMALAGAGSFTTIAPSSHLRSNIEVIEQFLPVKFELVALTPSQNRWRVSVRTAA